MLGGTARAGEHEVKLRLRADPSPQRPRPGRARSATAHRDSACAWTAARAACTRGAATAAGSEREWTLLGASRGEGGILGEGIRQALLRDPTYGPALAAAQEMLPDAQALVPGGGGS